MVTHTPRLLHSSPSLSSLPPLSFLRLRDLSHPLIWPDMHNVKNSTDAEQGQAGWLSCLTEKWLADVKLSNWKEWNMVIRAGESLCFCLWALVCSWRTMDWHLYMFFFSFQVCMPVCLNVALDDLHTFSFSTSSFTLHCLMCCCYWQPQPKRIVEPVQMSVQQVLCFQSPGENWRGETTWTMVHVFSTSFMLHSVTYPQCDIAFCKTRDMNKL